MFERFLKEGIAIAGVDVGESYGSQRVGRYTPRCMSTWSRNGALPKRPVSWAGVGVGSCSTAGQAENPDKVRCITGIYPVCNIASYPGLKRACGAYGLTVEEFKAELTKHNPIDRLAPLAKAKVPIFHIHGDNDSTVPLDKNSAIIKERYDMLDGAMMLEVVKGQGHNMWAGWFQSQNLVDFVIKHATKSNLKK